MEQSYKMDAGKPPLDLVPPELGLAAARAFAFGAAKYSQWNWLQNARRFEWGRLIGALERHLAGFKMRHEVDAESGLDHLDHMAATLAMLLTLRANALGVDDRRPGIPENGEAE